MMVIIIGDCSDVAGVAVTDMEVNADVCSDFAGVSVLLMTVSFAGAAATVRLRTCSCGRI